MDTNSADAPGCYNGYEDRSVSLAHREAMRVAFEEPRLLAIVLKKIYTAPTIPADSAVTTPCCLWSGKHSHVGDPVAKVGRASTHGVNVSRLVWMAYYKAELPPQWFVYRTCGNRKCLAPNHMAAAPPSAHTVKYMRSLGMLEAGTRNGVLERLYKRDNQWYDVDVPMCVKKRRDTLPKDMFDLSEWVAEECSDESREVLNDEMKEQALALAASMISSAVLDKEQSGGFYAVAQAIALMHPLQIDYALSRLWAVRPQDGFIKMQNIFDSDQRPAVPVTDKVLEELGPEYYRRFNVVGKKDIGDLLRSIRACYKQGLFNHVHRQGSHDVSLAVHECRRRIQDGQKPTVYAMERSGVLRNYKQKTREKQKNFSAPWCP